jgi:short-subunit dehydrogenase
VLRWRASSRAGARIALVARREDRLGALAGDLAPILATAGAPPAFVHVADLADPLACDAAAARVEGALGVVDVLVNNAGLGDLGPFSQAEPAAIERMIDVNILALTRLTRRFLPGMMERRQGWIMNIASAGGFHPMPLMAVYGAAKAYVISLSEALHIEARPAGVVVTCICPGTTRTEFFNRGGFDKNRDLLYRLGSASAEAVARSAVRALASGRMLKTHGAATAVQAWVLTRMFPRRATARLVGLALKLVRG